VQVPASIQIDEFILNGFYNRLVCVCLMKVYYLCKAAVIQVNLAAQQAIVDLIDEDMANFRIEFAKHGY